jgi:hypothetical protein
LRCHRKRRRGEETKRKPVTSTFIQEKLAKLTLADFPNITELWHPKKNRGARPGDYEIDSRELVWLEECEKYPGEIHEWSAIVSELVKHGDSVVCPICVERGGTASKLRDAEIYRQLASQEVERNGPSDGDSFSVDVEVMGEGAA